MIQTTGSPVVSGMMRFKLAGAVAFAVGVALGYLQLVS